MTYYISPIFILFYCRLFEKPEPEQLQILEAVDSLRAAVESRLKSNSRLPLTIDFPTHIFKNLFEGKGAVIRGWLYLEEADFNRRLFKKSWDVCLDSFGEGHKISYPIRLRSFLSWSPKKFVRQTNGQLQLCSRAYQERLSFSFARSPC